MLGLPIIVIWSGISSEIDKRKLKHQKEEDSIRQKEQNILFEKQVIHLGGHPYLNSNDVIYLQIHNNNELYFYKENNNTGDEIPINQITKYELKTDEQIQKDVTLSRFLMFGIASLALKKETKSINEYLLLSYIQNGISIDCLFRNIDNQSIGNIISTLNRLKIESNNEKECVI